MMVFTISSAVCSFAPSAEWLIAARIIQGLGGALVMGTGLALIAGAYEGEGPKKRQTAIGVFTGLGAAAAALGPLVGGTLVAAAALLTALLMLEFRLGEDAMLDLSLFRIPTSRARSSCP